jgi:hypothetical protein
MVALRPERVRLANDGSLATTHAMTVAHVVYQGETVRYILKADTGLELQAVELGEVRFTVGDRVHAGWAAEDARILPSEGDFVPLPTGGTGLTPRARPASP